MLMQRTSGCLFGHGHNTSRQKQNMKRIIALAAAVAVSTVFARVVDTQSFETSFSDFEPNIADEDASELVAYDNDAPDFTAPYNFEGYGDKYLSLDTGDATLWRTNAVEGDVYFDMAMQFNPSAEAPEVAADTKIAVYQNSSSNVVILAGDGNGGVSTNVTTTQIAPGTWGRLTISAVQGANGFDFTVRLNGTALTDGTNTSFPSMTADTTITHVGFSGTGKLDDFVARTTDPYLANPAVQIGGEGYASIQDALNDAGASSVVELLANNADAVTLGSGESLKLKLGEYAYTGTITLPNGYIVSAGTPDANGVTTYSQVEGVAAVKDGNDLPWVWYATFEEAYAAAAVTHYYPDLKVKVGDDFVLPNVSRTINDFRTIEFIATTENPIDIALTNANYYMASTRYTFPANATLHIVSGSLDSISGGTLNVPNGVVLELASYATDGSSWNITGLTGSGTIKNDGKSMYFFLGNPNYNLPTRMRDSSWCGTLELCGSNTWEAEFNKFANANSKVRFNGLTTPLWDSGNDTVAIELVGDGLTITNGTQETATSFAMGGTITGSGSLTFASSAAQLRTYNFTGDFSGFAGNLTIASGTQNRVYIGSNCTGNGACISIANGATATVAAGKTWNSQNGFVVLGTLNVAGTLKHQGGSAANQIYGTATTGKIVFKNAAAITTFGGSYAGEIVIDSIAAGDTVTAVPLNFGCSSAKLTLNGVSGNAWCAGSDYTIAPEVTLAGDVNFQNGSSEKTVVFRKIAAGTGNLSLKTWTGCRGIAYNFTEIDADNYSGTITLDGNVMTSTIGNIIKAGATAGDKVLDLVAANSATVDISSTTLNGAAAKLVQLADGVYVAIDIAIPTVENTTASVTVDGVATEIVDGGVAVAPGARVVVTYAANEGYVGGGEFVIASASASSAVDTTDISAALGVAQIGETKYATLNDAVAAARDGDTIAIIANCAIDAPVSITNNITVSNDYTIAANVNYAFCIGATVTVKGSGTIERASKISGSPFCVGANETTRGSVTVGTSGALIFEGLTVCGGTNGNMIKLEKGTVTMNGGVLTGAQRGIKADADVGGGTSAIVINGGTITNCSQCAVMASAASPTGTATVVINGGVMAGALVYGTKNGTCTITIPGTSTAKFDSDCSSFCETGYGTKQSGDWYVVAPLSAIVFISGEGSTTNEYSIFNGDAVTPPAAAEIVGKSFSAWDPAVVSPAAGNATYTALYTNNIYSVTYNLDLEGATNAVDNIASYTIETAAFTLLDAGCEGYTFNCWTNSAGETVTTVAGGATGDVTLYASWTQNEPDTPTIPVVSPGTNYTIVCDSAAAAATVADTMNVAKADYIKAPTDPVLSGDAAATYASYFTARADGTSVVIEMNETGTNALATVSTNVAAQVVSPANLAAILSDGGGARSIGITGAQPGFYYSLVYDDNLATLDTAGVEGSRALAEADGSVQLPVPAKEEGATSGFYRVKVSIQDKAND